MDDFDKRPSRLAALPLAIVFLFETWVWRKLVALAGLLAGLMHWERFRDEARRIVARLPAFVSVALFGIPLAVAEFGSFISVVMIATGHVFTGTALYVLMKVFGLVLVPVIFEITRDRLLALPWFAWAYVKFAALQAMASGFVAPYRKAALDWARETVASGWRALSALVYAPRSAAKASAAKAETLASSARAVGVRPASPSQ